MGIGGAILGLIGGGILGGLIGAIVGSFGSFFGAIGIIIWIAVAALGAVWGFKHIPI